MNIESRVERRRVRWFFAGLLTINGVLDIVDALLIHHQTRSEYLESLLPSSVTLGGRTGIVMAGLALLLLAGGVARGKRVAWQLTVAVLLAAIVFDLVKDLDIEDAALAAWIVLGLWWMRHHFRADSDPARARLGLAALAGGIVLAVLYGVGGSLALRNQLAPRVGVIRSLEHLAAVIVGSPATYHALTARADWFLVSLPIVSYTLVIIALTQLLRPVLAPRAGAADRERVHALLRVWGRNHISHLAVHGAASYYWLDTESCVAFSLHGRTALALGDPIGPPASLRRQLEEFAAYCDQQDWIPAFYQVAAEPPYRDLRFKLVPIGAEALIPTRAFTLEGPDRRNLRYSVKRCERQGVRFTFMTGPEALESHASELRTVSGMWLASRRGPELGYSLGTLATLTDPDIVVGVAVAADQRLEAFVSMLPVPVRKGWTLDLMRRRPDAVYGAMEALIVKSIQEASRRGIEELSLGMAPRVISTGETSRRGRVTDQALRAMFWGLDRFQRGRTLQQFKAKFGPVWEDRYLAVPDPSTLAEVLVALVRAHMPSLSRQLGWFRGAFRSAARPGASRRAVA